MKPGNTRPRDRSTSADWVKTSSDCALDALVVAAAVMIAAQAPPRAASRMALLVAARRTGLQSTPPRRDVLAELDSCLRRIREDATQHRRLLVSTMNMLVGSPLAPAVRQAAIEVGTAGGDLDPAGHAALRAIETALALTASS